MDQKTYNENFVDIQFTWYELNEIKRALKMSLDVRIGAFEDRVRASQHERLSSILDEMLKAKGAS